MFSLLEILYRPGKVFERVRKQRIWLAPFAATVVLAFISLSMVIQVAGIEIITLQRFQKNPKLTEEAGEAGVEAAISTSNERVGKTIIVSRETGLKAVALVLIAAAFTAIVAFLDKKPNFFAMLGTVSYAAFPFALLSFLVTAILLFTVPDHSSLDLENPAGLHLGRLLDRATTDRSLFQFAASIDLWIAAEALFMSYGLTKVTSIRFTQALAMCAAVWAVVVLWRAALVYYV
jgi:hypothetical protein